jgi:hypothetical protein
LGRIEGVAAPASRLFPGDRRFQYRVSAMWCGSDCRDLVFHAIEPLDEMGKLRCGIALHVLDLTRKFGDRAALGGVHSLDVGFENADVLGHFAPCGASRHAPRSLAARQSGRAHRKNTTPPPIRNQIGRPPGPRVDHS